MLHVYLASLGLGAIAMGLSLLADPDGSSADAARGPSSLHFWTVCAIALGIAGLTLTLAGLSENTALAVSAVGALGSAALLSRASPPDPPGPTGIGS